MSALAELLVRYRPDLLRFMERHAGSVLRFESPEDLVQGAHLRALEYAASFTWRGREPFLKWMHDVARSHIGARRAHWAALKRRPAALLRLTLGASTDPRAAAAPAHADTGPATLAGRLEQASLAVKALDLLLERDRQLVQWAIDRVPSREVAERLQMGVAAADRAKQRAVERYRKAFRLLASG